MSPEKSLPTERRSHRGGKLVAYTASASAAAAHHSALAKMTELEG